MLSQTLTSDLTVPTHDEHLTAVYRYAAHKGSIDTVEAAAVELNLDVGAVRDAVDRLLGRRLLRAENEPSGMLVPVDPDLAAATLVTPMEREIYQRRELIAQIRGWVDVMRAEYAGAGQPVTEQTAVECVTGTVEVRGSLKVAADGCGQEAIVLHSGMRYGEEFEDLLQLCGRLLDDGVTVRLVCQHRGRSDFAARLKIRNLLAQGASVRTAAHVPRSAVVFDRSVAVLLGVSGQETTASHVRTTEVAVFVLDLFEHLWDVATPFTATTGDGEDAAADLRRSIAGLMANGLTDEALARKLGMSVRTCRRHIGELMRGVDAVSRFQAGVQAARQHLV